MADNNINGVMDSTIDKIRSMVDSETIVGEPIVVNNITIIPVSKLSFGFASGGSDFPSKTTGKSMFGGGGGAGATVSPVVFIVVKGNEVKLLPVVNTVSAIDSAVNAIPELAQKLTELFKKEPTVID